MALADIIARIDADAQGEADAIMADAREQADGIIAEARSRSEREAARTVSRARAVAETDAETIVVKARLAARDSGVARRRELVEQALAATVDRLAALPDSEYVVWLAKRVVAAARGEETLRLGAEDVAREEKLRAEVARLAPELHLARTAEPAAFARGVLLEGDRVRADLSLSTIVNDQRDALELVVARELLGEGD